MSGSEQHDRVALESVDDQPIIGAIFNRSLKEIDLVERQAMLNNGQELLRRVAQ